MAPGYLFFGAGRQYRDHGVAGPGHVEHLARPGRQVDRGLGRLQQGHATLAAGDQQAADSGLVQQLATTRHEFGVVGAVADRRLELAHVRRHQAGPAIGGDIRPFRVDDHRLALVAGARDERCRVTQGTLGIVRQDDTVDLRQGGLERCQQRPRVDHRRVFLEVEPDQLLVAADHAQLGNRRMGVAAAEVGMAAAVAQQAL